MGVRGLTTFIAKNQETYFKKHKLRDSYVVIDAHSLCAQLYKCYTKSNDCFGGDYDKYKRTIETFFSLLKQCNVTPIVIFDGGYEKRKLKTVFHRLKAKIRAIRSVNPVTNETVFPLFVREVFKDTILKLNILTARCDYEADFEIACIARQLNCPVISYDSDFYIFDCLYIPFPTMDFHVTKINDGGTPYYIQCKIYKIDNFLKQFGGLERSQIPLMACLLGNDYIRKARFKSFYAHLKLSRKKCGERGDLQRQITAVIKWLWEETYESAVQKVLGRMKKKLRARVAKQIRKITQGYICTESEILKFLKISEENPTPSQNVPEINLETIETDSEDSSPESDSDSEQNNNDSEQNNDSEDENEDAFSYTKEITVDESEELQNKWIPEWFMKRYRSSEYPTLFMDLLSFRNCFYMPQVEDVTNIETLEISLPILRAIAKILLMNEDQQTSVYRNRCKVLENDDTSFIYYARNEFGRVKQHNIEFSEKFLPKLFQIEPFDTEHSLWVLTEVMDMDMDGKDKEMSFINKFPQRWHLFLLSLIFWIRNAVTPTVNFCHIAAIFFSIINMEVIDKKIGYYRLKSKFLDKYSAKLKTLPENKKSTLNDDPVEIDQLLKRIDKDECLAFANNFISNFSIDEKLQSNFKAFNINVVDAFAQFQNCLLYAKYLNSLVEYPLEDCNVADFYNGTFIYNLYTNFASRNDVDAYIDLLLRSCPSIKDLFRSFINLLTEIVPLKSAIEEVKKKRRRKRRGKGKDDKNKGADDLLEKDCEDNISDNEIDYNNKFALLRLVE